jgi:hypothetical protein
MSFVATGVRTARELLRGLPQDAKVLWYAAREYCSDEETDGVIATSILPVLGERAEVTTDPKKLAAVLVKRGLWEATGEGWIDVTFLDVNPTHEDRQFRRDRAAERKREWRRQADVTRGRHTGTSHGDGRDGKGRFTVVSHRDVPVATETETERNSYSRRGSTSPKRTRKGAEENGYATEDEVRDLEAAAVAEEWAE